MRKVIFFIFFISSFIVSGLGANKSEDKPIISLDDNPTTHYEKHDMLYFSDILNKQYSGELVAAHYSHRSHSSHQSHSSHYSSRY